MDNPQERRCCSLSWIAGIIDGEGCINVYTRVQKRHTVYRPRIVITNTSRTIIDEVCRIFDLAGFPYYVQTRNRDRTNHNTTYDVIIAGFKRVARVLPQLVPYLRGKKDQAILMCEFVTERLKLNKNIDWPVELLEICELIQLLNKRGNEQILRDYTPSPSKEGEDIVRAYAKA